jgi:excisionase family DNA binding protein
MEHPLAYSIAEACARSGIGRTAMYDLINNGQLPARKRGRRTLILAEDLRRCLETLPVLMRPKGREIGGAENEKVCSANAKQRHRG